MLSYTDPLLGSTYQFFLCLRVLSGSQLRPSPRIAFWRRELSLHWQLVKVRKGSEVNPSASIWEISEGEHQLQSSQGINQVFCVDPIIVHLLPLLSHACFLNSQVFWRALPNKPRSCKFQSWSLPLRDTNLGIRLLPN